MKPEFWQDRSVFVTGHTGFKGGWLCLWLHQLGARVTGYSRQPPTRPSLFEVARVGEGLPGTAAGEVADLDSLSAAVAEAQPEIVFHLAAQAIVKTGYNNPLDTYESNVRGTWNLLEAVRREAQRKSSRLRAVVVVTSDKCYEDAAGARPHKETDRLGGRDPYSNSKSCAELVTAAYNDAYFLKRSKAGPHLPVATARAGNVVGGGDWGDERLVPDVIGRIARGEIAEIKTPKSVRPWQHVLNPLSGYLLLAEHLCGEIAPGAGGSEGHNFAGPWNFGPTGDESYTTGQLATGICKRWGDGADWTTVQEGQAIQEQTHYLRLNSTKANETLLWRPPVELGRALDLLVEWYRAFYQGKRDLRELTLEQIAQAQQLLVAR